MQNIIRLLIISIMAFVFFVKGSISFAREFKPHQYTVVKASHILVSTQSKAQTLKIMLDQGEDFAYLARQYSQCPSKTIGGDLGYFKRGQMVKEFELAAFELPIGQVSETVQTQFGWHLIKVSDKR